MPLFSIHNHWTDEEVALLEKLVLASPNRHLKLPRGKYEFSDSLAGKDIGTALGKYVDRELAALFGADNS